MVSGAQDFGAQCRLDTGHAARLAIMIEELVTNLVEHGGIGEHGVVELVLTQEEGVIAIALSDTGVAFDLRAVDSGECIPDRGGGAGIDLVRAWAEIVDYRSGNGENRLILKMWLS
jgi:anti-sigma regulatory factor (Ser/Thr protein kinase)